MSMVVISPDISHNQNGSNYNSGVNKRISSQVANKFFELIKNNSTKNKTRIYFILFSSTDYITSNEINQSDSRIQLSTVIRKP